ncbi:AAA family ATPase [Secundilactobacillus folii]|nr:AAA family ATPase [Secundilactobacillus folii]
MTIEKLINKQKEQKTYPWTNKSEDHALDKEVTYYSNKLRSSHNIILHGAPGTGKTYLAKQIAAHLLIDGDDDSFVSTYENLLDMDTTQNRLGFVQFHPSYDYTDFVEGLRPVVNEATETGQDHIGFQLQDGIFKQFCQRARTIPTSKFEFIKATWAEYMDQAEKSFFMKHIFPKLQSLCEKEEILHYNGFDYNEKLDKQLTFMLYLSGDNLAFRTKKTKSNDDDSDDASYNYRDAIRYKDYMDDTEMLKKINQPKDQEPFYQRLKDLFFAICAHNIEALTQHFRNLTYVFIIDEINRGELSKIFGELFYSIDPSYRGQRGAVTTQYQSMHQDTKEQFYVPDNVYIIGTMNDIDRSVEPFDFAMRRRFRFLELTAESQKYVLKGLNQSIENDTKDDKNSSEVNLATDCMTAVNQAIKSAPGFAASNAHEIGPAYFLKLQALHDNIASEDSTTETASDNSEVTTWEKAFAQLWTDYLQPIISEYAKELPNSDTFIQKVQDAFCNAQYPS